MLILMTSQASSSTVFYSKLTPRIDKSQEWWCHSRWPIVWTFREKVSVSLLFAIMLETWHLLIFKIILLNFFGKKRFALVLLLSCTCRKKYREFGFDGIPYWVCFTFHLWLVATTCCFRCLIKILFSLQNLKLRINSNTPGSLLDTMELSSESKQLTMLISLCVRQIPCQTQCSKFLSAVGKTQSRWSARIKPNPTLLKSQRPIS